MGMDLLGRQGDARFSHGAWADCLDRAIAFGWQPEGTVAPQPWAWPGEKWGGSYLSNDYQHVTDQDARALGEALLRAADALSAKANVRKRRARLRLVSPVAANVVAIESPARKEKELPNVNEDPLNAEISRIVEDAFGPAPDIPEDRLDAEICCMRRLAEFALKGGFTIA